MPSPVHNPIGGIAFRLTAVVLLSAMFALGKAAEQRGASLAEIMFWRQAFAVPVVLVWVMAGPGLASLKTARPWNHARRMVVGTTGMALNFSSFILLPMAEATAFGFTVPIFGTILSALALKESVGIHRWAAVALGFAGVLIVLQPGDGHVPLIGGAVALGGAILTAVVSILIRDLGRTETAPTIVFWFTATSLVPLAIPLVLTWQPHDPPTWALITATGLCGGAAQLCLTAALRLAPVSVVLPMDYTSLIWATLIGWLVFGMLPSPLTWLGAPLIIASGLYIVWREHRLKRAETATVID